MLLERMHKTLAKLLANWRRRGNENSPEKTQVILGVFEPWRTGELFL